MSHTKNLHINILNLNLNVFKYNLFLTLVECFLQIKIHFVNVFLYTIKKLFPKYIQLLNYLIIQLFNYSIIQILTHNMISCHCKPLKFQIYPHRTYYLCSQEFLC